MVFPFESLENFEVRFEARHEELRRRARKFAEKELKPILLRIERAGEIPRELLKKACEEGFLGLAIPKSYGGSGGDLRDLAVVIEELARISPAFGLAVLAPYLFTFPILLHGTEEQKEEFVKKVVKGEFYAAHAATEPVAGSDLAGIRSRAKIMDGEWILSGHKHLISGAGWADYFLTLVKVKEPREMAFFIVGRDDAGVKVALDQKLMGVRGLGVGRLILRDVRLPGSRIVGRVGEGFRIALETYSRMRIGAAALSVGILQSILEKSLEYSTRRKAFGRPIIDFQGTRFKVVEILGLLTASRLMLYWAARVSDHAENYLTISSSMAKLYSSMAAEEAAIKAVEIHGGFGVLADALIERFLRDAEIMKLIEGTGEIQKLIIARELLKRWKALKMIIDDSP